jgi:hypothetical protein
MKTLGITERFDAVSERLAAELICALERQP